MVKNHAQHAFEPKYLMDSRVLNILNKSMLLLIAPNGREFKTNINYIKPATTLEHIENAWNSFLNLIKTKCQNLDYNLRLHS